MRFLQLTALALLTVLVLEFTVRLDDWSQFGVPLTSRAVSLDDLVIRDSLGLHARAGAQFRQFRIDAQGFRGPDRASGVLDGPLIITSGASETFGLYEERNQEWPRQLEDSLAGCTPSVTVLNAAFAGMSLPTVEQDFMLRLKGMRPAFVVYYPTPMQYLSALPLKASPPAEAEAGGLPALRSRALPRFRDAFKRALPEPAVKVARGILLARDRQARGMNPQTEVEKGRLDEFENDLRRLVGTYRASGTEPVLVVHRNRFGEIESSEAQGWLRAWERFYPAYTGEAIVNFDAMAAERVVSVGKDSAVAVVDPLPKLRDIGSEAFADYSHFSTKGAGVVGGEVARALRPRLCSGSLD